MKTECIVGWDGKLIGLSLHKRRTAKVDLCWFGLDKIHVPSTATQLRRTSKEIRNMLTTPVSVWEIQHQDIHSVSIRIQWNCRRFSYLLQLMKPSLPQGTRTTMTDTLTVHDNFTFHGAWWYRGCHHSNLRTVSIVNQAPSPVVV